ncbi:HlyD family type I secretion periplasmic adaptor subunit [Rhodovulum adriaticum]|uniref:Membrane fusion protein (MFP) family protein n=1 Tax=Rhodovulum adriaticum TaxID=35804 RepID=A0A4R2NFQ8_RHOAD|nr:HlyD family type I secretion periplasmic adaptor subunit [Rhodovulum adriaticum]MBK1637241.1 secretion protein HlyD [Rhodovulum adriaticum]TCP20002.1 adhesin transport system membrane fusion protein [Rhodovulum adriaticum]
MSDIDFKRLSREMSGRDGLGGSAIMVTIIALVSVTLVWASWAELDNVTRGDGRIISSVQNQVVQAAEGGVILRRFVSENSKVAKGEILFEIDPVDASSELNQIQQRRAALRVREARLRAEITGAERFETSADLRTLTPLVAMTEESLFAARRAELAGQLAVLEQRRQQSTHDLRSAQATRGTSERTAILLEEEIAVVEPLVRDNIAPSTRLLELQRQLEQARGERDRATVAIEQARSATAEIETEIENARAAYRLRAMDELSSVVSEQSELDKSLPRLKERVSRTVIRAPMDGIVSQLNFRTPGGYVNTGDAILELVPTGEALIIEARIRPQDISRIRLDDAVRIRLSAYDSAKYGTLNGRVTLISPDAVVDDETSGESYYRVDVAIEGDLTLEGMTEPVTLIPGMTATVDVLSGTRTVLEYFWQPVARVQELALRD